MTSLAPESLPTDGPNRTSIPAVATEAHLTYRPDIDGLRAVAIVSVVLFHAFPSFLHGGFVGVDLFFAISGYLISSIIFKGFEAGDFSFREFYRRRIQRTFPALILVLVSCFAVGWFALLADELKMHGKHMAAGVGFVQNIVLYKEAGYFDTASETKPLLHLWSLGVEEQFYIFFPLVVWALWRRRAWLWPVIVVLAVASLWAGGHELTRNPAAAFYLSPFRVWEIMLGSLAGHFTVFRPVDARRLTESVLWRNLTSTIGAALLVSSITVIERQKSFPGLWALLPVCGSALMILAGPGAGSTADPGKSSHGLDRADQLPALSLALARDDLPAHRRGRRAGPDAGPPGRRRQRVPAWGTYRGVELPLRRARLNVSKAAVLLVLGAAVVGLGWLTRDRRRFENQVRERLGRLRLPVGHRRLLQ